MSFEKKEEEVNKKIEEGLDLDKVLHGLEIYGREPYEKYDEKAKKHIENLLTKLQNRYEYCPVCSRTIAIYALKENLLTDLDFMDENILPEKNSLIDEILDKDDEN